MPIAKEVVDRFMSTVYPKPPKVKGVSPDKLLQLIKTTTGVEYQEITKSRPHQLEGVAFALHMKRAMLFYWMRLGKTKMALDWAAQLRRAGLWKKKGLIITHAPIGSEVWEGQVVTHSQLRAEVIRAGRRAVDRMIDALESDCDLVIMSLSTIQTLFTAKRRSRKGVNKLYPDFEKLRLMAGFFDLCVIDETHYYSNPYSLFFSLAHAITQDCVFRLGLTGTPVGRNPFALWSQTALIDDGKRLGYSYPFFEQAFGKTQYAHFRRSGYETVFDKKKMPILQYKLDSFSLAYGKNEIKTAQVIAGQVILEMKTEQKKYYNDAVNKLLKLRFDEEVEVEAIFVRLRQIASGFLPFTAGDGNAMVIDFPSAKLEWLKDFASEVEHSTQCLIFHEYIHTGELICKTLKEAKKSFEWIHGGDKDRGALIERFRKRKVQFLVANTATGGTAIDLPEADYLCFFESPCDPKLREQAAARPMARGDRVLVMDDLLSAPIEHKILGFIAQGENLMRKLAKGGKKSAKSLFA